jgi:hypothetical protein
MLLILNNLVKCWIINFYLISLHMSNLDKYIKLTIADSSISVFNKSDFQSYTSFSKYIRTNLKSNNVVTVLKFMEPIINEINYIYGFSDEESTTYVIDYFLNGRWSTYHSPAQMARSCFGKFLAE